MIKSLEVELKDGIIAKAIEGYVSSGDSGTLAFNDLFRYCYPNIIRTGKFLISVSRRKVKNFEKLELNSDSYDHHNFWSTWNYKNYSYMSLPCGPMIRKFLNIKNGKLPKVLYIKVKRLK